MTAPARNESSNAEELPSETPSQKTMNPKLAAPLLRFRISAWVTGVGLLGLCFVMVLRYAAGNPGPSAIYSPIHGVLYMIYLVMTIDLAIKARWAIKRTVLVLLAGCVPFVSFVVEHRVNKRIKAG